MSSKGSEVCEGGSPGGPGWVSGKGERLNTQPYINPALLSAARPGRRWREKAGWGGHGEAGGEERAGAGSWGDAESISGSRAQGPFGENKRHSTRVTKLGWEQEILLWVELGPPQKTY